MGVIQKADIQNKIYTLRDTQVMLDSDLAPLYGTETKFVNRAVKRNVKRFPKTFVFQLSETEWEDLKYQSGTSSFHGGRRTLPHVFTEQGIAMLSSVLNTDTAIEASIQIMQAFVVMRKFLLNNISVFQRLDHVELKQLKTDKKIEQIFDALEAGKPLPDKGVFFDGQIFDAYELVSKLIRSAKKEIILIDNYIDESTLTHLSKKATNVQVKLYTKNISKPLKLDVKKANQQYGNFNIYSFKDSHDRFLIIDDQHLYHIGASLKDLGKKWFAFSQMDSLVDEILNKLN